MVFWSVAEQGQSMGDGAPSQAVLVLHPRTFFPSQARVCIIVVEVDVLLLYLISVDLGVSVRRDIVVYSVYAQGCIYLKNRL